VATVCAAAGLPQAHHSLGGVYDMKGEKELSGTLTSVKFTNPHSSPAEWVTTLGSATALARRGTASPLGFLKTAIMPDGRVIQISAGNPND
jgi:hypothetical protein